MVLKESWEENISKGLIHLSSSPFETQVLFENKPDGGLRFCIDYWDINSKTLKNWYPHPLIKETFNHLGKAQIYTNLNVKAANTLL